MPSTSGSWHRIGTPAGAIYAGPAAIFATNLQTGDLWRWDGGDSWSMSWTKVGGPGKMFVVLEDTPYRISPDGSGVWQYTGTGEVWHQIGGPAGTLYGRSVYLYATNPQTGEIVRWNGRTVPPSTPPSWTKVGGPGKMFAIDGAENLYGLSPDSSGVWKYTGTGEVWIQIGGPAGAIYAGWPGVLLYATNPQTGDLWRWDGTPMSWTKVGGPKKMFALGAIFNAADLYGLSPDSSGVWQYTGTGEVWHQIGGPASAIYANGGLMVATNPQTGDIWAYEPPAGGCTASCTTSCTGGCTTGCTTSCTGGCTGGCQGGCTTSCTGGCTGGCQGGCTTSCEGGCTGGCEGGCTTSCEGGATAACREGWTIPRISELEQGEPGVAVMLRVSESVATPRAKPRRSAGIRRITR